MSLETTWQGCLEYVCILIFSVIFNRQGVILADEVNNFEKLLYRVGRTNCLLSQPHPLAHMSQLDVTAMSPASFHSAFIRYCIKNNFVNLLYHYLDVYK